jgi:hypothetical protein
MSGPTAPVFSSHGPPPFDALVLIYDIVGFSQFFNEPDAQRYVPRFINAITDAINITILGGLVTWALTEKHKPIQLPPLAFELKHRKFLGDGELIVWRLDPDNVDVGREVYHLMNRLWIFQRQFGKFLESVQRRLPVSQLPSGIRFALGRGDVYELLAADDKTAREYVGRCINLTARLVKYCPDLSFIASARVEFDETYMREANALYYRLLATKVRSFNNELVYVNPLDFVKLKRDVQNRLFRFEPGAEDPEAVATRTLKKPRSKRGAKSRKR